MKADILTITQIKTIKDSINAAIIPILKSADNVAYHGSESEYTHKDILILVKDLLVDISALVRVPRQFLSISTHTERNGIFSTLTEIKRYLNNPTYLIQHIESLKTQVRPFHIKFSGEKLLEVNSQIDAIKQEEAEFTNILTRVKDIEDEASNKLQTIETNEEASSKKLETFNEQLSELGERKQKLLSEIDELEEKISELTTTYTQITERSKSVDESYTNVKSNEKIIDSFAQKVQTRDKRLEEIANQTDAYEEKLSKYTLERESVLSEAEKLINTAKQALNYKTAEGLSASFQVRIENAEKSKPGNWLWGAGVCLFSTTALGIWLVFDGKTDNTLILIGRLTLIPILIAGTIFCANQYSRIQNIIEDYAYKVALSKSLVGFSEQIKKHGKETNEEYMQYITMVLKEIHKDPLRGRKNRGESTNNQPVIKIEELISSLSKLSKDILPKS